MSYEDERNKHKPERVKWLLIMESPPPADPNTPSSRHFYRADQVRKDDRVFTNTIKALYPEAGELTEAEIQPNKQKWLQKLQQDGVYVIEALEASQVHEVTKKERQAKIKDSAPRLVERVRELDPENGIILIKSNVFDMAAEPLKAAGFPVLNTELVDYPGQYNQKDYHQKLSKLMRQSGWQQ